MCYNADMKELSSLDKSLRRLGGILAAPSLLMHYGHTTPALEMAYLRRIGLTKDEREAFMDLLCRQGQMDEGVRALLEPEALRRGCIPAEAARQMMEEHREETDDGISPHML